eukprot:1159985-Pelagomonas_calceolata.AAC.10
MTLANDTLQGAHMSGLENACPDTLQGAHLSGLALDPKSGCARDWGYVKAGSYVSKKHQLSSSVSTLTARSLLLRFESVD